MVKYPRYIFKSELVLQVIRERIPEHSNFLEIGCADGELSYRIAKLGLTGDIYDISEEAIRKAKRLVKEKGVDSRLNVYQADPLTKKTARCYDLIVILDVLEHIENDKEALYKINSSLKKNGFLLIAVPAKKSLWGPSDRLVGHYRRYEKEELQDKLKHSGFEIIRLYSFGFPFLNIIKLFREFIAARKLKNKVGSKLGRTKESGLSPIRIPFLEIFPIFNRYTLLPFIKFSNLFNNYDLAEGYLCLAEKKREAKNK